MHQNSPGKCPLPCGVLGANLGSGAGLGASFSVSVLNDAKGSDGCLLEPQTEYEAPQPKRRGIPGISRLIFPDLVSAVSVKSERTVGKETYNTGKTSADVFE